MEHPTNYCRDINTSDFAASIREAEDAYEERELDMQTEVGLAQPE